ncbi:hypothetical protein GALMADRAFT_42653, partial [Galerina marginata CBS 339.88]
MVYHHISEDMKNRVLCLLENGNLPDAFDIAEIFGISKQSIYRWRVNFDEYDSIIPPPNPSKGCPHILNADQTHDLITLLQEAPKMYLDKLQDWVAIAHELSILNNFQTLILKSALHYSIICNVGISYKVLQKAASEQDEVAKAGHR